MLVVQPLNNVLGMVQLASAAPQWKQRDYGCTTASCHLPLALIGLVPHCCAAQLPMQLLRGMDLYVGAGGLGYLDFVSLKHDKKTGRKRPDPNG